MKRIFITLTFILAILTLSESKAIAQSEKAFDILDEITYGEECLKSWQIGEASAIANKLLSTAAENPNVCFFAGEVRFYEGNYEESLSFLKEAQKDPDIAKDAQEFYSFVDTIYKTTGKFKEIKTEHFLFRYVEDKDAILADYALDALEKNLQCHRNRPKLFSKRTHPC